tara:strand:- start:902 stop:1021 length:120 start_codon:yes stop_codon:yes gene_type:complete
LKKTAIKTIRIAEKMSFATVQDFSRVFSIIKGTSPRKNR